MASGYVQGYEIREFWSMGERQYSVEHGFKLLGVYPTREAAEAVALADQTPRTPAAVPVQPHQSGPDGYVELANDHDGREDMQVARLFSRYNTEMVKALKTVGARWNGFDRCWQMPATRKDDLLATASRFLNIEDHSERD